MSRFSGISYTLEDASLTETGSENLDLPQELEGVDLGTVPLEVCKILICFFTKFTRSITEGNIFPLNVPSN
jgi:hypothetical protein